MTVMNETIRTQLAHERYGSLKTATYPRGFRTAYGSSKTDSESTGMQACSIIRVTDPDLRKKIAGICKQEYVVRAPELLIFIVDLYRNNQIAEEKGCFTENARDMDRFFASFTDACIMAQNVVTAAESMGLGTVYFGSILNDSRRYAGC